MRLLSIILSSFILIQSFQISFEDLTNFDEFIEHAKFHKMEHGDSIFVFISKHYGLDKEAHSESHPEEKQEHEHLPFQCQGFMSSFIVMSVNVNYLLHSNSELNEDKKHEFFYQFSHYNLHLNTILQPPQFA